MDYLPIGLSVTFVKSFLEVICSKLVKNTSFSLSSVRVWKCGKTRSRVFDMLHHNLRGVGLI